MTFPTSYVTRVRQEEENLGKLKSVFENNWRKAAEYATTSYWTLDEVCKFGMIKGEVPPDNIKFCTPEFISTLIDMAQRGNDVKDPNISMEEIIGMLTNFGYNCKKKALYDISLAGKGVATIFPEDKYIQFHDEYTQVSNSVPKLRELIGILEAKGFTHNHS